MGREPGECQGCGVNMGQPFRFLADERGLDRELFAIGPVATGIEHAEHRIADLAIDAVAGGSDYPGKVPPRDQGKYCLTLLRVLTGAKFPIDRVDACRDHVDDYLAGRCHRIRQIAVF